MKKVKQWDERVYHQNIRIRSDAFGIIKWGLFLLFFAQFIFGGGDSRQYIGELILIVISTVYVIVRYIKAGVNIFSIKFPYLYALGFGAMFVVVVPGIMSVYVFQYDYFQSKGVGYLIGLLALALLIGGVILLVFFLIAYHFNKKRQAEINQYFDEEEQEAQEEDEHGK
jgi:hypothetical protein